MRQWTSQLFLLLMVTGAGFAQRASVNVEAENRPIDRRPFGKYLVQVCRFTHSSPTAAVVTISCTAPVAARSEPLRAQTITMRVVCDPSPCDVAVPTVGKDFLVQATSDSGLPIRQRVLAGNITPREGSDKVRYHIEGKGPIIIRGSVNKTATYDTAAPVDVIIQPDEGSDDGNGCPVLPASYGTQSAALDPATIVTLLGNPTPFLLAAEGSNAIFIYATRQPTYPNENAILAGLPARISALASQTAASLGITPASGKPFTVELRIPHWSALGDLATRIGTLNYSQFIVQDVGRGQVRVTAPSQPDCDTWKGFLKDIRETSWQLVSQSMSNKLYYLSSSDVATAFSSLSGGGGGGSGSSGSGSTGGSSSGSGGSATPSASPSGGGSGSGGAGSGSSTPGAGSSSAGSSNATISITQPPGSNLQISSDTTPCVIAGLVFGNSGTCASGSTGASVGGGGGSSAPSGTGSGSASTQAQQAPLAMSSVAVAAGIGEQTPPDLLVYSDSNPGDDAQIQERNRVIAELDLPRPEMILTAWVTQDSSTSQQAIAEFNNLVKSMVADYDNQFESVVLAGWESLKEQSSQPDFFNQPFRTYVADRFVAENSPSRKPGASAQDLAQALLDQSTAKLADSNRGDLGICDNERYCLGYNSLFRPIKPALTDLLLTLIAAQEPIFRTDNAIAAVEGQAPAAQLEGECGSPSRDYRREEFRKRCRAVWQRLEFQKAYLPPAPSGEQAPPLAESCETRDFEGIFGSLIHGREARVHLQCFKDQAHKLFVSRPRSEGDKGPYAVGLLRSAIADFLFNYKMSQQYPHEFTPYDLTQSANALNYALSPLIDAFNRDLWTYLMFVRADVQYRVEQINAQLDQRCCVKRLFGLDKPSFFNDGLVTVRTISGQATSVSTTSQSYLNGSTAPELSALLSSLAAIGAPAPSQSNSQTGGGSGSGTSSSGSGGGSGVNSSGSGGGGAAGVGLFGVYGALPAVLANYQTTFAQIGRQLSFTATPRSLATASSAEIAVTLNADDAANTPVYSGANATDPAFNTSRVANHDTTTRVRVDSIKLFEVSSFSAIVERSRSRFPLLPPFVEIPYIGTFAGIPLGAAKEFHSSTAIISAYVVPTAADIAYGLRFVSDLLVDSLNSGTCSFYPGSAGPKVANTCLFRKMYSQHDVGREWSLREFNRKIIGCFSMDTSPTGCGGVAFSNVIEVR